MIVKCPACAARFRLDREKLAGKRVTLRCARCREHFKIELPREDRATDLPTPRVMVAHSDYELCETIRQIVVNAGMDCVVGHEGQQVLEAMVQAPPQVAVVDVALQGLYAFEVVDKVRRRPGLSSVKIILLSSVYNKMAYKRSPSSLYGADDYIEKHHIPDDLVSKVNRLLVAAAPAPEAPGPREEVQAGQELSGKEAADHSLGFIESVNDKIQSAENHEVAGEDIPERERAERLARIIVSDIALYYQDRVDDGIRNGNWSELLASEIKEARNLFRERFPAVEIQQSKILESSFMDLFEKRRRELDA